MSDIVKIISWSLTPGIAVHLLIMDGRLVRKRSSVLWSLVGKSTIWERPSSWNAERKAVLIALLYWCPSTVSVVQSMSGRLRSPLIQMVADLLVFTMC